MTIALRSDADAWGTKQIGKSVDFVPFILDIQGPWSGADPQRTINASEVTGQLASQ
jgi:hypothetical protein